MKRVNQKISSVKLILMNVVWVLSITKAIGQNADVNKYIKNDSIRFDVINTAPDFENGVYYSGYVLVVNSLDSIGKNLVKDLKKDQWLSLLRDSQSDWAANIILYSLYKKRAAIFWTSVRTRESWIEKSREADLAYWQSFLK